MVKRSLLVMKFGGVALQDVNHFRSVVHLVLERKVYYDSVVVVVSAMAKTTDYLLGLAREVHPDPPKREQDMLVSVGERISMALLAMAFAKEGHEAISFTGSQAGIITTAEHTDAKVIDVIPRRLKPYLEEGRILIVAGFQGVSKTGEITTLGRGGSDTSAVALGIALGAEKVEFYKDVGAIFEEDPREVKEARPFSHLSYEEALSIIAKSQKKVLHPRAVEMARKNALRLDICSLAGEEGTRISAEALPPVSPHYEEVIA